MTTIVTSGMNSVYLITQGYGIVSPTSPTPGKGVSRRVVKPRLYKFDYRTLTLLHDYIKFKLSMEEN